jgi:spermidine synthase
MSGTRLRRAVYVLFFVSGACALAYEVVWMRLLVLVLGASTPAVSLVLAVFMAGLALGARLLGGWGDRARSPLRLYGQLEIGIGLAGLLVPPMLQHGTWRYVGLVQAIGERPTLAACLRGVVACTVLLPPTLLMGATLPVLIRFVGREGTRLGRDLGTLYAVNVAGAVAGTVLTGSLGIRFLGIGATTRLTAAFNLAIGLLAALWAGRAVPAAPSDPDPDPAPPAQAAPPSGRSAWLWVTVALSGFVVMALEVVWTRALIFTFQSTVYSFTIILATCLLGLALGSAVFGHLQPRWHTPATLGLVQILAGGATLLCAPLALRAPAVMVAVSAWLGYSGLVYLVATALASALTILVPATLMGMVFPLAGRLLLTGLATAGGRLGRAVGVNTLGAIGGSLGAGFLLIPALTLKGALLALGILQMGWGLALAWRSAGARVRASWLAGPAATAAIFALTARLLPGPVPFDSGVTGERGAVVRAHRDGVTATVAVVDHADGTRSLRIDGFVAASDIQGADYMAMMAHLPLLLHPSPKRALVVCFGTGTTAGSVGLHGDVRVDAVDINPDVFAFAPFFRHVNHDVASSPRAQLIVDDGRHYVLVATEAYDLVTSEPMPPTFAGVVNLYSREYYELARRRLRPGGFLTQWLPIHLLTTAQTLSVLRTVQEVFPETTLWLSAETGVIVARRDAPVRIEPADLEPRLREERLFQDLHKRGVTGLDGLVGLFALGPDALRRVASGEVVTDDRPSLEFHPPRHLVRHVNRLGRPLEPDQQLEAILRLALVETLPLSGPARPDLQAARRRTLRLGLGDVYAWHGRSDEAWQAYQQALIDAPRGPSRGEVYVRLATLALGLGRSAEAQQLVTQALAEAPASAPALNLQTTIRVRAR